MASPAVTALLLALAVLAAVEAAVQPIAETAFSTVMQTWLHNLKLDAEDLSDKLWDLVEKRKASKQSIKDLLIKVTAHTDNIQGVHKAVHVSAVNGCIPNYFPASRVKACEQNARTTYQPQLKELYKRQQALTAAVNKFVRNPA